MGFRLDEDVRGAVVTGYSGGNSPARSAGLERGDVIVRLNGREVRNTSDLQFAVADALPGQEAEVEFLRDGRRRSLAVVLGQRDFEEAAPLADGSPEEEEAPSPGRFGIIGQTLTPALAARLEVDFEGVVVLQVVPGSSAARAGLQERMIIIEVAGRPTTTAEQLTEALASLEPGETFPVWFAVFTGGEWQTSFVIVESPEAP